MIDQQEFVLLIEAGIINYAELIEFEYRDSEIPDTDSIALSSRIIVHLQEIAGDIFENPQKGKEIPLDAKDRLQVFAEKYGFCLCDEWWGEGLLRVLGSSGGTITEEEVEEEQKFRAAYAAYFSRP